MKRKEITRETNLETKETSNNLNKNKLGKFMSNVCGNLKIHNESESI